jgi:hypothetical protein
MPISSMPLRVVSGSCDSEIDAARHDPKLTSPSWQYSGGKQVRVGVTSKSPALYTAYHANAVGHRCDYDCFFCNVD